MFSNFLTLALLALATVASASPTGPNAQRLARGLSPLPPKVRDLPRGVEDSTPVFAAKRSSPSSKAGVTFTGRVQVRRSNGDVVGLLWSAFGVGTDGISHINRIGPSSDLHVTLSTTSATIPFGPIDVRATNADNPNFQFAPFLGLEDFSDQGIAPGSANSLVFTNVLHTPPGSPPVNTEESSIWFFNPVPRQLTAQWINPTTVPPAEPTTIFALHPAFERVFVVGDLAAWNAANPGVGAVEVFLFLVD